MAAACCSRGRSQTSLSCSILKENLSGCSINELANLSATHSGQKSVESAKSSDSSTSICCQLCPAVRKYPQDMKFHYALSHVSDKFEEYFVPNKGACKFCSKIFLNRTQQIGHLLSVHKFVQNLIPYVGKIPERKAQLQNQIISDPDPGIQNRIFSCHICNEEFTRRFKLVCHMSLKHYRDELKKYYGEEVSFFHFIYIVGSRGASQLGGIFWGTLQGIRLISYSLTKLPSWYNKNTCLMLMKHSLFHLR